MKKSQTYFTILLLPLDFLMLMAAAILAYEFRIGTFVADLRPVIYNIKFADYLLYAAMTAIIWQVIGALNGLYNIRSNRRLSQEIGRIIISTSIGLLLVVFAVFLKRELFSSRFIILTAWIISIITLSLGRWIIMLIQRSFFKRGLASIKVVLIGSGKHAEIISDEIHENVNLGFRVIESFSEFNEQTAQQILNLHKENYLDEILVVDPSTSKEVMIDIIDFAEVNHLGFRYSADIFNTISSNISIDTVAGIPLVELKKTPLDGWGKIAKRLFDIISSVILIILTSPITIITAIAVMLESKGPIIFKNERVGEKGITFDTLKFRSMKSEYSIGKQFENAEQALKFEKELIASQDTRKGPLYKIQNDPRLTRVGRFIRKWSIDELPQLFNVLKGDMSLVGPRPHQPREVAQYEKHHRKLLMIKPGITGMAQVSGRSDLSFEDEATLDLYYIENWSLWLDIIILFKTPLAVVRSRKTS